MDGNPPLKLRYLPAPADPSQPSPISDSSALAKSRGLAEGGASSGKPSTITDGVVVVYFSRLGGSMYTHERITLSAVAEAIAQIKGAKFAGLYDDAKKYSGNVFFVPDDTLMLDEASRLGIRQPISLGPSSRTLSRRPRPSPISSSIQARIDRKAGLLPMRKWFGTSCCRVTPPSASRTPEPRRHVS